jgi:hypothetical protein
VLFGFFAALENTVALAFKRIQIRNQAHPTLLPSEKLEGIIVGFSKSWENISDDETDEAALILQVDITSSLADITQVRDTCLKNTFFSCFVFMKLTVFCFFCFFCAIV